MDKKELCDLIDSKKSKEIYESFESQLRLSPPNGAKIHRVTGDRGLLMSKKKRLGELSFKQIRERNYESYDREINYILKIIDQYGLKI